MRQTERQTVR